MSTVAAEKSYQNRPKAIGITVRRLQFNPQPIRRHYFANSPVMSHLLTALSSTFPIGEQFFVHSVRNVRDKVKDENLQAQIAAFIGQEAMHSKEHLAFNSSAQSYGYDIRTMEQQTGKVIRTGTKVLTTLLKPFGVTKEMIDLTGTCALEHFTAVIAAELLQNKDVQAMFNDSTMHQLWMWHAVEENEHKAVVFDVYTAIYGHGLKAYTMRAIAMIIAMGLIFMTQSYFTAQLMKIDGKLTWKDSKYMLKFMYARKGFMTRQIPELLDFFRPNFHPNDSDTDRLLADWKLKLGL